MTGENTGETVLDPVVITDDLSEVLNNATLDGDPQAFIDGVDVSDGLVMDADAMELSWSGMLQVGESVSITYAVSVNEGVQGEVIKNIASATAQPPGNTEPIVPETPDTTHPVPTPGFDLRKSSDPGDGAAVVPGDRIAYTVTGENTGETVLEPVVITDDLSEVLNNATLDGEPQAVNGDRDVSDGLVLDADAMQWSWTGVLEVGESVSITYAVTVNDGVSGTLLLNRATASGTPPGSTPLSPPRVETEHPVPAPGFEIDNTGGTVLDPVVITDDLDRVLGHADYNRDAKAVIGDRDVSDGIRYDAAAETISWTGALEPGESVQLVYSVTVKTSASTGMIENRVSGSATPPGNDPLNPPDKQVVHRVGVALATTGLAGGDMAVIIGFSMLMILTGAAIAVRVRRRQEV